MKFANPGAINMWWLVIGMFFLYVWSERKKQKLKQKFAQKKLLSELTRSVDTKKQQIKNILILLSLGLIIFSLMRPQWGFRWYKVKRIGLDIIIALDTSKSMLAQDIKPNRLKRAKIAIKDFVSHLKGDRIALLPFAGEAFLLCPLTVDYSGFLLSLDSVDVNTIPRGGTAISTAIEKAIKSYQQGVARKYKILIIISDGEDHQGNILKTVELAKKEGIKIFCIGVGTLEGELIYTTDKEGNRIFLKDAEGKVVKTKLNEELLKKIALTTGGSYIRAGAKEFGLNQIYKEYLSRMEKREFKSELVKRYQERFHLPLLFAFLLLVGELFIDEKKRK